MKVRFKIELLVVIGVILTKFWNYQLLECRDCQPSAVILGAVTLLGVLILVRRASWLAVLLAISAVSSGLKLGKVFLSAPHAHSFTSDLLFTRDETVYLVFTLCLLDLLLEWRRPDFTESAI